MVEEVAMKALGAVLVVLGLVGILLALVNHSTL